MSLPMISFSCQTCRSSLSMDDQYAGKAARCPTCQSVVNIPARSAAPPLPPPRAAFARPASVQRFGFPCPWCNSRLEATQATVGQQGQCPTCGNTIRIPIIDRYGRLIDPETKQIIKPDPHPVHAYAAAGDRAPQIVHAQDGALAIQCPRCQAISPINANACRQCGIPFTLEGTVTVEKGPSNGMATTSLVLGLLGLPTCMLFVPSILAILFGVIALTQVQGAPAKGPRNTAITGIVLGAVGLLLNCLRLM